MLRSEFKFNNPEESPFPAFEMATPVTGEEVAAWRERAPELARFAMQHLVNRKDVWLAYLSVEERTGGRKAVTVPRQECRGVVELEVYALCKHFRGESVSHLIGLHAISESNTSRWGIVDIDAHGETNEKTARCNFHLAQFLQWRCRLLGLEVMLMD